MSTVVLASGNRKKLAELQLMLAGKGVHFVPQSEFHLPEAEETGLSFIENAIIKARHASLMTGLPALADDSGLEVDALGGAPGIHSARFASPSGAGNSSDEANNALLLERLKDVPPAQRSARFHCAIALLRYPHDPMPLVCTGSWEGFVLEALAGQAGFGYDPLFYVPTHRCSAAELPVETKNSISHRAQALQQLSLQWRDLPL